MQSYKRIQCGKRPFYMDFECSLHFACTISISGIGLSATNKVMLVEATDGRCGNSDLPALDAEWAGVTNPSTVVQSGPYNQYNLGTAMGKSGAAHRLCWAHRPELENEDGSPNTDLSAEFRVEIDADFLWVRFTAVVDCVPGRACTITVYGVGFSSSNRLLLIESGGQCGSAAATAVDVEGLTNPVTVVDPGVPSSTVGVYELSSSADVVPPTGFRICWAADPEGTSPEAIITVTFDTTILTTIITIIAIISIITIVTTITISRPSRWRSTTPSRRPRRPSSGSASAPWRSRAWRATASAGTRSEATQRDPNPEDNDSLIRKDTSADKGFHSTFAALYSS